MTLETLKHAWQSQANLKAKDPKPITPVPPKRGQGSHQDLSLGTRVETQGSRNSVGR